MGADAKGCVGALREVRLFALGAERKGRPSQLAIFVAPVD